MTITLQTVVAQTSITLEAHIDDSLEIPVLEGLQAQGDLLVIPVTSFDPNRAAADTWQPVTGKGIEVVRGEAERNPHVLIADADTCEWMPGRMRSGDLALGWFRNKTAAWLVHPEHGANGFAAGTYEIRRQQEHAAEGTRIVAD